mmetsp:Transcript_13464/g.39035  ORF Transcript_13464/g.39035 Transcript_13464/m.39035 type:complete len:380 (-) Transcript_13464:113-1252(-)
MVALSCGLRLAVLLLSCAACRLLLIGPPHLFRATMTMTILSQNRNRSYSECARQPTSWTEWGVTRTGTHAMALSWSMGCLAWDSCRSRVTVLHTAQGVPECCTSASRKQPCQSCQRRAWWRPQSAAQRRGKRQGLAMCLMAAAVRRAAKGPAAGRGDAGRELCMRSEASPCERAAGRVSVHVVVRVEAVPVERQHVPERDATRHVVAEDVGERRDGRDDVVEQRARQDERRHPWGVELAREVVQHIGVVHRRVELDDLRLPDLEVAHNAVVVEEEAEVLVGRRVDDARVSQVAERREIVLGACQEGAVDVVEGDVHDGRDVVGKGVHDELVGCQVHGHRGEGVHTKRPINWVLDERWVSAAQPVTLVVWHLPPERHDRS